MNDRLRHFAGLCPVLLRTRVDARDALEQLMPHAYLGGMAHRMAVGLDEFSCTPVAKALAGVKGLPPRSREPARRVHSVPRAFHSVPLVAEERAQVALHSASQRLVRAHSLAEQIGAGGKATEHRALRTAGVQVHAYERSVRLAHRLGELPHARSVPRQHAARRPPAPWLGRELCIHELWCHPVHLHTPRLSARAPTHRLVARHAVPLRASVCRGRVHVAPVHEVHRHRVGPEGKPPCIPWQLDLSSLRFLCQDELFHNVRRRLPPPVHAECVGSARQRPASMARMSSLHCTVPARAASIGLG
mmetsp:Transcript_16116/g.49241  ORF Transcript_16116/g.49241 Transcript_16116/m.49241 type:complete len:303 (-) Transcript_16116:588-1496(-)